MDKEFFNRYRVRRNNGKYVVVTDHGQWIILSEKKFRDMRLGKMDDVLRTKLYEKGILLDEKNVSGVVDYYRNKNEFINTGASLHIIVVTKTCNNICAYCHASAVSNAKHNMSNETAKKVVDFIMQSPTPSLTIEFQGGETLMNFEVIKYIVNYANEVKGDKKIDFGLVSNLNTLNDDVIQFCRKNKVNICTSLDGPKKLHDCQRSCLLKQSSYDNTTQGIQKLQKEGFKIGALSTITKQSLSNLRAIIDEYIKQGQGNIHLRSVNALGYAKQVWGHLGFDPEEFLEAWRDAMNYIIELNKQKIGVIRERQTLIFLRKIFTDRDPNYLDIRSPCGAVIGQMSYDINGDICSCDEGRMIEDDIFRLGNVRTHTYKEIIESDATVSLISASILDTKFCDTCAYKPFCGICPVLMYSKENTMIGTISASSTCKIHIGQLDYIFDKLANDKEASEILLKWLDNDLKGKDLNKETG